MDTSAPRLRISRRSGKVRVVAEPGAAVSAHGGTVDRADDGAYEIRARGGGVLDVRCPPGSDLTISTSSGAIDVQGDVGAVSVTTSSGNLAIERAETVDVRGTSGRVEVGACAGDCRVVIVSSNVRIGEAGRAVVATVSGNVDAEEVADAEVKTVSGNIALNTRGGGRVRARSISGSIEISVPPGVCLEARLKSISGRVRCECEQGHDGEVSLATVSGTISVACR